MAEQGRAKAISSLHFFSGGNSDSTTTQTTNGGNNTIEHVDIQISKTVRTDADSQIEEFGMGERGKVKV